MTPRTCGRADCRWPASASLSYRYGTRQVWLLDLSAETDPSLYDLCPHHADALVVPRGWDLTDRRTRAPVVTEPAGADLAPAAGRTSRYAGLMRDLPRIAAELAAASVD